MIYRERGISIDIGKAKDNFDKDKKLKCFNYNIYRYIVKNCQKPNKEKDTRKCYKCNKIRYIVKDCISEQKIKNCSVQDESNNKEDDKQKDFGEGPEQIWYKEPMYLILKINILFQINEITKKES